MKGRSVAICVVVNILALGIGVFGGALFQPDSAASTQTLSTDELKAEIAKLTIELSKIEKEIAETQARLEIRSQPDTKTLKQEVLDSSSLKAEIERLKAELSRLRSGELSQDELQARIAEIMRKFDEAVVDKNGSNAVAAMREISNLDQRAFPELFAMWQSMEEKSWLGLQRFERFGWTGAEFLHWALNEGQPSFSKELALKFQSQAIRLLGFVESKNQKLEKTLIAFLRASPEPQELSDEQRKQSSRGRFRGPWGQRFEGDPYRSALGRVSRVKSKPVAELLSRLALDVHLPVDVRQLAIEGLRGQPGRAVDQALLSAINDPNKALKAAAEMTYQQNTVKNKGYFLTSVATNGRGDLAGLKVGDLITAYNGQEIQGGSDMWRLSESATGESVEVSVLRSGTKVTLKVKPRQNLGIVGNFVEPRAAAVN